MIVTLRVYVERGDEMAKKKASKPKKQMGPIVTGGKPSKKAKKK